MSDVVSYEREDNIALFIIDNPPVNALSTAVRQGLWEAVERFAADGAAQAAVLLCAGRTFIAGADIREFNLPPQEPLLPKLIALIEQLPKPVVAALHGTVLGGGLETALGCHYRCAHANASLGFPEVNLGLLPGAGGTQRLPRLAGVRSSLEMILYGKPMNAGKALDAGIIDSIIEGDLRAGAVGLARQLLTRKAGVRRVSEIAIDAAGIDDSFFSGYQEILERKFRGYLAPFSILKCIRAAVELGFDEGIKLERRLFEECKASPQSRAQRHLFFAERAVGKVPGVTRETPVRDVDSVAVVGAGVMGSRIALVFINAGIPVVVKEISQEALDRGLDIINGLLTDDVAKGRINETQARERLALVHGTLDYAELSGVDLVIEAVFEQMDVKKTVFSKLSEVCGDSIILASNTSALDLNEIAAVIPHPENVVGMHFYAPANVMKLLEVVRTGSTAAEVLATVLGLARRLGKTAVVVGVCPGFVGNRMFIPYIREAQHMMLEGTPPERIDRVAYDWGMAMGPNGVTDLSGIDIFYEVAHKVEDAHDDPAFCRIISLLHEMGRYGQKTGAGIFQYDGRKPIPDPAVMEMAAKEAQRLGVEQREIADEEILERLFYPMVNEGARILEEGIATRSGDIDVIWTSGFGMPRYQGGPMMFADMTGLEKIRDALLKYRERYSKPWWAPAQLLEQLVREGKVFGEWENNSSKIKVQS